MIVNMKKAVVFCLAAERERATAQLQELGALHVVPFAPPAGDELESVRARAQRALATLEKLHAVCGDVPPASVAATDPAGLMAQAEALLEERVQRSEALVAAEAQARRLAPLGAFDPETLRRIERTGLSVRVFQLPAGAETPRLEGLFITELRRTTSALWIAAAGPAGTAVPGEAFTLPETGTAELARRIEALRAQKDSLQRRLKEIAAASAALNAHRQDLQDRVAFLEARDGMARMANLAYMQGFIPVDRVHSLEQAARREGWGLLLTDPSAGDSVPTLIREPFWARPIRAVFEVVGIAPAYTEVDIGPVFLVFLSVFVAMIIGDAGYGALILLGTMLARRKLRAALSYPFSLMYILSACTIIWGLATGSIFGIQALPPVLEGLRVDWLREEKNVIRLCFLLGAIHLTVAHSWNILRALNSQKMIAQAGWISITWGMYFLANNQILGSTPNPWTAKLILGGVTAVALFMTAPREFKTEWYNHLLLPLDVISNFVDVVSYVRLYAVGIASLALAMNFNSMAVGDGITGFASGLAAALILAVGHALNILLSAMGVLVHGVRLNTLEFSKHMGLQWAGFAYAPLCRRKGASGGSAVVNTGR